MSNIKPEDFDKEADEIYKRISNKRMAEIRKLEMKYDKEFRKYDKMIDTKLDDEIHELDKRIKNQVRLSELKSKRKYLNHIKF